MDLGKFSRADFWRLPVAVMAVFCLPVQAGAATAIIAPVISIVAIHSPIWSESGPRLMCRVRVENPNAEPLFVSAADVNLKLAGSSAANGWLSDRVIIPANAAAEVNVIVNVLPSAAISWMPMFLGSGEFSVPFEVTGTVTVVNTNLGSIPFHETGAVEMRQGGIKIRPSR